MTIAGLLLAWVSDLAFTDVGGRQVRTIDVLRAECIDYLGYDPLAEESLVDIARVVEVVVSALPREE